MRGCVRAVAGRLAKHVLRNEKVPKGLFPKAAKPRPPVADAADGEPAPAALPDASDRMRDEILTPELTALLPSWLLPARAAHAQQACPLLPPVASPVTDGYRNKISHTVGFDTSGKPCVGARVGKYADNAVVARTDGVRHTPAATELLTHACQAFFDASPLPVYDMGLHAGVWRTVVVRYAASTNTAMLILITAPPPAAASAAPTPAAESASASAADAPQAASDSETYRAELLRFVEVARGAAAGQAWTLSSVFLQEYGGLSMPPPNHPYTLLLGENALVERMCGLQFRLSPGAFFQVNTLCAELLYDLVRRIAVTGAAGFESPASASAAASSSASTVVPAQPVHAIVDVCCGTGTIALVCARDCDRVIGVELEESAIVDARANAALNGITNAEFHAGRAEALLRDLLDAAPAKVAATTGSTPLDCNIVAIVDPPRAGLHPKVIRALRTCRPIKRVVYVSCNPSGSFIDDSVKLCGPQEASSDVFRGPPFKLVMSQPVDLFPHTPHCELVTLFERA